MSDYLWDKDGPPDPEVEQLEKLLRPLGYRGKPPRLPRRSRPRALYLFAGLLAAAAIALLLLRPFLAAPSGWATHIDGTASVDGHPLSGDTRLAPGAWLDTGPARARLTVADIGTVDLEPATRARIVTTSANLHKLELAIGTLSAHINAPPRHFMVATPHTVVIDLGCAFNLTVDKSGAGHLTVSEGAVALTDPSGREVTVPAGSQSQLTPTGPTAPTPLSPATPLPTPAPTPTLSPTPAPVPTGKPMAPTPKSPKAPTASPTHKPTPPHKPEPTHKIEHAPKPTAPVRLTHDPLKDLERSTPP